MLRSMLDLMVLEVLLAVKIAKTWRRGRSRPEAGNQGDFGPEFVQETSAYLGIQESKGHKTSGPIYKHVLGYKNHNYRQ